MDKLLSLGNATASLQGVFKKSGGDDAHLHVGDGICAAELPYGVKCVLSPVSVCITEDFGTLIHGHVVLSVLGITVQHSVYFLLADSIVREKCTVTITSKDATADCPRLPRIGQHVSAKHIVRLMREMALKVSKPIAERTHAQKICKP